MQHAVDIAATRGPATGPAREIGRDCAGANARKGPGAVMTGLWSMPFVCTKAIAPTGPIDIEVSSQCDKAVTGQ